LKQEILQCLIGTEDCDTYDATVQSTLLKEQKRKRTQPSEEQTIFCDLRKQSCQFLSASKYKRMEPNALQVTIKMLTGSDFKFLFQEQTSGPGQAVRAALA
jgi:hypothetical protein